MNKNLYIGTVLIEISMAYARWLLRYTPTIKSDALGFLTSGFVYPTPVQIYTKSHLGSLNTQPYHSI